jgi:PKD repeat protein
MGKTITVAHPEEENRPPTAAFNADAVEGTTPLSVAFTDISTGTITGWKWDFGDGNTAQGQNQEHTFTKSGTYAVILTISGPGGEDRAEQIIKVRTSGIVPEKEQVKASFSTYNSQGPAPCTVSFLDTSTGDITGWEWDFGDGSISTEQNPRHTYTKPGTYPVYLTGTSPSGESKTDATLILVTGSQSLPWSDFNADPTEGSTPLSVSFSDTSTGQITEWIWDFGDGTTTSGNHADHTYTIPGLYTAVLTVKGSTGESRSETTILVKEQEMAPVAGFNVSMIKGQAPHTVNFSDTSTGLITGWEWNFGDGTTSLEQNCTHTYVNPGIYTVTLSLKGPGGTGKAEKTITVTEGMKKPSADFTADITNGSLPLRVHLYPVPTGKIDGYFWDLGDGTISYDKEPVHVYETSGHYQVSLSVSGPGGVTTVKKPDYISTFPSSDKATENLPTILQEPIPSSIEESVVPVLPEITENTITMSPADIPLVSITRDGSFGPAPLRISFRTNASGIIDGYAWDFGDGGYSYDSDPIHVYTIPGNYSVKLVVTGPDGISEVKVPDPVIVTEGIKIPVAAFSGEPALGYAPLIVNFTEQSSGTIDTYLWNFGDGATSPEKNPRHQYSSPGTYSVTLTVTGLTGSSEENKKDYITVDETPAPPVARFTADYRTGRSPLVVTFQDMASGMVTGWNWDLGDGNSSSEKNPVHTYGRPGVYTVSQTVSGPGGKDTAIRRGYIIVSAPASPPVAAMYAEPVEGVAPLPVKFLDMSAGSVTSWNWDLGDGSTSKNKNPIHIFQYPGIYTVSLQVSGSEGSSSSEMIIRVISLDEQIRNASVRKDTGGQDDDGSGDGSKISEKPVANFTISERSGTLPLKVTFRDTSSGAINERVWSFGDGGSSGGKDVQYIYKKPGTFSVTLTVTGPLGSSSKRIREAIKVI